MGSEEPLWTERTGGERPGEHRGIKEASEGSGGPKKEGRGITLPRWSGEWGERAGGRQGAPGTPGGTWTSIAE